MWNLWKGRACSVAKSCQTLWDAINHSPLGSSVHGISQARILEWIAMPSSRGSSWPRDPTRISHITGKLFTTEPPGKRSLKGKWFLKYGQIYCLSHQGSQRILERVAYPFSRGFSQPRDRTGVSCIADRFFTSWATREALLSYYFTSTVSWGEEEKRQVFVEGKH